MSRSAPILLAEDDEADVFLLRRALEEAEVREPLLVTRDGQECIDALNAVHHPNEHGHPRAPCLLILDLKMPRLTGIDVLRWLRHQPLLRTIPVIIFSSSANQHDIDEAYALGANAFVVKPASTEERTVFTRLLKDFWLGINQPPLIATEGYVAAQELHANDSARRIVL